MKKWKNYLKKTNIPIVLLIAFFGSSRCGEIFVDTSISPEILPYFEEGDTLIYQNNYKTDSFFVSTAILYAVGEGDGINGNEDYERFESIMTQIDCTDSCYEFRSTIRPWEYYVGVVAFTPTSYSLVDYDKRYADLTLQIGKYKLENLYGSYNLKPDSITDKEINYVLYSKKCGVVEYKLNNAEVFQISEECITMLKAPVNVGRAFLPAFYS